MNPRTKLAVVVSVVFVAAAIIYGQLSSSSSSSSSLFSSPFSSSSQPESPFTAEGVVVSRVLQPEHYATPQPYPSKRQYGHAEARAKVWAQYLISIRLDNGEMMNGNSSPEAVDQFPVGQRVRIRGIRKPVMFSGMKNLIQTMEPINPPPAR